MPNIFSQSVLVTAVILLFASLWAILRIRRILREGKLRFAWTCLAATLLLAACGYLLFLRLNDIEGDNHHEDWLIALTLLVAAIFVFGVCAVSLFTARDLARISHLEKAAFFDPLTNLYTRGHIDSLLTAQCERSRSETSQLSVLLLDVDDFKFINDCFGHRAGDYVLKELGRILKQTVDASHLVGRYGGEEFLIVCPNTSPVLAKKTAEHVRQTISAAHLEFEQGVISVTVSIGVKNSVTFCEAPEDLVASADEALYEAKRCGRNRVIVADVFSDSATAVTAGSTAASDDRAGARTTRG